MLYAAHADREDLADPTPLGVARWTVAKNPEVRHSQCWNDGVFIALLPLLILIAVGLLAIVASLFESR